MSNAFDDYVGGGKSTATTEKKATGNAFDDYVGSQPQITESEPQQAGPNAFELGLQAVEHNPVVGNVVEGYAKAADMMDRSALNISRPIWNAIGVHPNEQPMNLATEQAQKFGDATMQGQQEHPILSGLEQGIGGTAASLPAFEMGSMGAGAALSFLPKATGPIGAAMLQGAQALPGMAQKILSLVTTGGAGAFGAGMQEELARETQSPGGRPDLMKIIEAGSKAAVESIPVSAGLGVIGEGVAKGLGKVHELRLVHAEKKAQEVEKAAMKQQQEQQAAQDEYNRNIEEADRTKQAREQAHLDERMQAAKEKAAHYQKQEAEQWKAARKAEDDVRKARQENIKNKAGHNIKDLQEKADASRQRAEYFTKLHEDAAAEHAKELEAWGSGSAGLTKARNADSTEAERANAGQSRAEHFQEEATKGNAQDVRALMQEAQSPPQRQPLSLRGHASEQHMGEPTIPRNPQPTLEERGKNQEAERKALSFLKKNEQPAEPAVTPPPVSEGATTPGDRVEVGVSKPFSLHAEKRGDSATVHGLEKGRSNKTRTSEELLNPEMANEGFQPTSALEQKFGEEKVSDEELKQIFGKDYSPKVLYGGDPGSIALVEALRQLPKSEQNYDGVMHYLGVQRTSDIFRQYDPALADAYAKAGKPLAELGDGLHQMFNDTRGKLKFGQLGAGKIDPETFKNFLQGHLTAEELAALPSKVKRALTESKAAIDEYKQQVKPILKFLDDAGDLLKDNGGLGRLRKTLRLQMQELSPTPVARGNAESLGTKMKGSLYAFSFLGKAANAVIHMGEKAVALGAREGPIGLGKAIVKAYKPGVHSEFAKEFIDNTEAPLTEALEENGVKSATSKAGKIITGQVIEKSPNKVATVIGLDKAAKELGYESGEALGRDILAAREGQGPLARDSKTLLGAVEKIQTYVSDLTGSNVQGFKDANVFQRSKGLGIINLFTTMPIVQARNGHIMVRELAKAIESGDKAKIAKAATTAGAYLFALSVVAGDKGAIPKDVEGPLRNTVGAPNYYHFMDAIHEARAVTHVDELPTIPHLQHQISPAISGGASLPEMISKGFEAAGSATQTPEKRAEALFKTVGSIAGAKLFGIGGGVGLNYGKAIRDGLRGYKVEKIYQHEFMGESHVGDVPIETNVPEALGSAFFGTHGKKEAELQYNAEKAHDIMRWVKENTDHETMKEMLADEKELDEATELHEIHQERDETIGDLRESGYADDSPEITKVKEHYTKLEAEGDKSVIYWRVRAKYWQQRADEIMQQKQPKAEPAPAQA